MKIEYKDMNWLYKRAKSIEKKNLNAKGRSRGAITILEELKPCVISNDYFGKEVYVKIDMDIYRAKRKEAKDV